MSTNYKNINKVSKDIKTNRLDELKKILPEVFTEGKVDLEKLKLALGQDIDERPERFNFSWAGKSKAIKTVLIPSKATLKPAKGESIKFDESENMIIEGDNLEVLKLFQKNYFGQVKMIYIDPPYNTGGDFVYHDDFKSPINSYFKQTGQLNEEGNKTEMSDEENEKFMKYVVGKVAKWSLTQNAVHHEKVYEILENQYLEVPGIENPLDEIMSEAYFIQMSEKREFDLLNEATDAKDDILCEKLMDVFLKDYCIQNIAARTNNFFLCKKKKRLHLKLGELCLADYFA